MVARKFDALHPRVAPVPDAVPTSTAKTARGPVRRPADVLQPGDAHPRTGRLLLGFDDDGDPRWGRPVEARRAA